MTNPWWLLSVGAGIAAAVLFGSMPPIPLGAMAVTVLVSVPLYMAGLGLGTLAGALACGIGILAAAAIYGALNAMTFGLSFAVPVAILVRQALLSRQTESGETEWYPPGLLVATLTVIGLLLAGAYTAILPAIGVMDEAQAILKAFAESFAASNDQYTAEQVMAEIGWALRLLPGMLTGFWMMALLAGGAIAQVLLERMKRNLRPTPEFASLELPSWLAAVAAAAVAGGMVLPPQFGDYAISMAFAACFGFLVQGLALVHAFVRKIRGGTILLLIFYLLAFMPIWPSLLVVLLGAVEQFAGFRRRWSNETES